MRVDANVSVRQPGEPFGTRCEIKNVNSVRSLGRAIEYEAQRQIDLLEAGEAVRQETRHWDETDGRTHTLRTQGGRRRLPVLPRARPRAARPRRRVDRARSAPRCRCCRPTRRAPLAAATGAAVDGEAVIVVVERGQDDYVLAVAAAGGDAGRALVHVKEAFAEQGPEPAVPAADLAALTRLEIDGALTATQAKQVLAELVAAGGGDAGGDRRGEGLRGDGHVSARGARRRRRSPPSPTRGRSSAPARARRWARWSAR